MNSIDNPLYKTLVQLGVKSDEARDAVESTHGGNLELLNYKFDSLDRRMNTLTWMVSLVVGLNAIILTAILAV